MRVELWWYETARLSRVWNTVVLTLCVFFLFICPYSCQNLSSKLTWLWRRDASCSHALVRSAWSPKTHWQDRWSYAGNTLAVAVAEEEIKMGKILLTIDVRSAKRLEADWWTTKIRTGCCCRMHMYERTDRRTNRRTDGPWSLFFVAGFWSTRVRPIVAWTT